MANFNVADDTDESEYERKAYGICAYGGGGGGGHGPSN